MFSIKKCLSRHFCKDDISLIENYEEAVNDKENQWVLHHRLELTLDGEFAHTAGELERMGMYHNRPYFELIFLKESDHSRLHNKAMSPERLEKFKKVNIGRKRPDMIEFNRKMNATRRNKPRKNYGGEFGLKYYNHYGYSSSQNRKQYAKEWAYWKGHGKCRWE